VDENKDAVDPAAVAARFIAVWGVADAAERVEAVAGVWAADGVEFVEGKRFEGQSALVERVTTAHDTLIGNGKYVGRFADDLTVHDDLLRFTIELREPAADEAGLGELAWAARVFLLMDEDGLVQQSYQITVKPLPPA
jgi:hypothetical protein